MNWSIVTPEYPPQPGGLGTYTHVIAAGLAAAGDEVHVWAPAAVGPEEHDRGVTVHRLPGRFGVAALRRMDRALREFKDSRWLIQYVPHGLGWRGMNLPFCLWLYARRWCGPDVMFHEVAFPFVAGQPLRHNLLARVQRRMASLTARAAARIFVATPAWEDVLRQQVGVERRAIWLPVPGQIPVIRDETAVESIRTRYRRSGRVLAGHLSTYPAPTRASLARLLPAVLATADNLDMMFMGIGSGAFHATLVAQNPALATRLFATGTLAPADLSIHLSASDLLVQIYPDGACSRRSTLISALEHQRAIVTCAGPSTEPLWRDTGAVGLARDEEELARMVTAFAADPALRARCEVAAAELYRERFAPAHTLAQLRNLS